MWENDLARLLHIEYPIIQAPMAGGPTTPELVAAVSNAGGLGTIGAGYMSPSQLREQIRKVKTLTSFGFGVNLFVPSKFAVDQDKIMNANLSLKSIKTFFNIREDIDIHRLPDYDQSIAIFYEQIQVIADEKVQICSFTFGIPDQKVLQQLKEHSIVVIGTATTVNEALLNEIAGMDAVVVQGSEAGGHRGTFQSEVQDSLIGLMSFIPQAADLVKIPLIAAGGIMDGRGVIASKILGAKGVQMGTAFLTCKESGANRAHKHAILHASEDEAVLTNAFSGKMARGIKNTFMMKMKDEQNVAEYPLQNELTKKIRAAAAESNNPDYMSLWSGQSSRMARDFKVEDLMKKVIMEAERIAVSIK